VFTVEVWNPIDEAQHYSYVESIATGNGLPVVGEDKLSSDILEIAKASPTQPFQSQGYLLTEDFDWGAFGESYEGGGVQGPAAAPGTYQVRLTVNGVAQTQPFFQRKAFGGGETVLPYVS